MEPAGATLSLHQQGVNFRRGLDTLAAHLRSGNGAYITTFVRKYIPIGTPLANGEVILRAAGLSDFRMVKDYPSPGVLEIVSYVTLRRALFFSVSAAVWLDSINGTTIEGDGGSLGVNAP
jgi:hypothetical protein